MDRQKRRFQEMVECNGKCFVMKSEFDFNLYVVCNDRTYDWPETMNLESVAVLLRSMGVEKFEVYL